MTFEPDAQASFYSVLSVYGPRIPECTNVGVIVYRPDGACHGWRVDNPTRARLRGDLRGSAAADDSKWRGVFQEYMESVPTLAGLRDRLTKTSHAMSFIRFSTPNASVKLDGLLDRMWDTFVKTGLT